MDTFICLSRSLNFLVAVSNGALKILLNVVAASLLLLLPR